MNLNHVIKIALYGTAALLPATGAFALSTADLAAIPATNIVYVAGSTATDPALKALFANEPLVCKAGTFTEYDTPSTGGYVLTCTAGTGMGTASNQNIAFVKQTSGGSAIGIHNVAAGVAANGFPNLTSPSAFAASCTGTSCTLVSNTIKPNAGISDEDPTTWIGTGGVLASDAAALKVQDGVEVPFGIVVSLGLRNQLQTLEGLVSGSDTLANVPSLSASQVTTILEGTVGDWGSVAVVDPSTNHVALVGDGSTTPVHICERGQTSGSEFAANIQFTGSGCLKGKGIQSVIAPDNTNDLAAGEAWTGGNGSDGTAQPDYFAFAGAGTGDVLKCLQSAKSTDNGESVHWAIGFASMDQVPGTGSWRYIAVDGVAPTIWNIQKTAYRWVTEDTFNYSSNLASINLNGGPGVHQAIVDGVRSNLSSLVGLVALNTASRNNVAPGTTDGSADGGLVTLGNTAIKFSGGTVVGPSAPSWPAAIRLSTTGNGPNSPIAKAVGGTVNNCNPAIVVDP